MDEIISKCKCGIYLEVNRYRDYYDTIEDAIQEENGDDPTNVEELEIDPELSARMIKENMFISLQFYPDTPIGYYKVYGTSVSEVVEKALEILKNN